MSKTNVNPSSALARAKRYAFLLLKFRLRSVAEMRERLLKKGFDAECTAEVIAWLKEKRFIDDTEFARAWVASRLKRPYGMRRIMQELSFKGLDKGVIMEAAAEASQGYDESQTVGALATAKMRSYRDIDPQKARRRLYAYLARRGFSPEMIMEAMERI